MGCDYSTGLHTGKVGNLVFLLFYFSDDLGFLNSSDFVKELEILMQKFSDSCTTPKNSCMICLEKKRKL